MRNASVEYGELIEGRGDHIEHVAGLEGPLWVEAAPEVQRLRTQHEGLATGEPTLLPAGEREHVCPRPVRDVRVNLLDAAIDVVAEPGRGDGAAAAHLQAPAQQPTQEVRGHAL